MINRVTGTIYSEAYREFQKNEKFFSIPMFNPEVEREFCEKLDNSDILILEAQTGAGKSVVAPIHAIKHYGYTKKIAISQPRTINVTNIAATLAKQLDDKVGNYVGYTTGSGTKVSAKTKCFLMTDAILFQQLFKDIEEYDIVIIDEFHERNTNIDMCLGLIKRYYEEVAIERKYRTWLETLGKMSLRERVSQETEEYLRKKERLNVERTVNWKNPTKFILLSATIDYKIYMDYYRNFNISYMFVAGRSYPITDIFLDEIGDIRAGTDAIVNTNSVIEKLLSNDPYGPGDILVFCSGKAEIIAFIDRYSHLDGLLVGGIYRGVDEKVQELLTDSKKYRDAGYSRRLIFATNIAETGVTIDGLKFVVDMGIANNVETYDTFLDLSAGSIPISAIKQRCGRVGRTAPGTCFHMYGREVLKSTQITSTPAIYREPLKNLILKLMLTIGDTDYVTTFLTETLIDKLLYEEVAAAIYDLHMNEFLLGTGMTSTGFFVANLGIDYMYMVLIANSFRYKLQNVIIPICAFMMSATLKDFVVGNTGMNKYRNDYGEPLAYFMLYVQLHHDYFPLNKWERSKYCEYHDLSGAQIADAELKLKDLVKKIGDGIKVLKSRGEKEDEWRIEIDDFEKFGEKDELGKKINIIFGEVFNDVAVYIEMNRSYYTDNDNIVKVANFSRTHTAKYYPEMIGYIDVIRINGMNYFICPFTIIKKQKNQILINQ